MAEDDPFEGEQWDAFVKDVHEGLLPKLGGSAVAVSLVPEGPTDVRFAVQLGFMIMMDKPILAVVAPGVDVSAKLRAVADVIVTGRPGDPDFQAKFNRALHKMIGTDG